MQSLIQHSFGGPDVLVLEERPRPVRNFGDVLVRVHAASVNPIDLYTRAGVMPILGPAPVVPGWDISGVVEEIELGTTTFKVGDEVFGMPLFPRAANAYAEYVVAPAGQLWHKPAQLSHAQAASLALAGLTSLQALRDIARLQPSQRVLVHGAGGGVGHLAVQVAKAMGAHVIATASASKHAFVRRCGADEVIDYTAVDFTQQVGDVDVVFDVVGGDCAERSLQVLRPGGIVVTALGLSHGHMPAMAAAAGKRFSSVAVQPDGAGLRQLAEWVAAGRLTPHVSQTFPLAEGARAHRALEAGSMLGKAALILV